MKKMLLLAFVAVLASFYAPVGTLSKKERKMATTQLKATQKEMVKSIKGLSDAQLNFKPAPDKWSVKECVYHIALSETNLWQWVDGTLKAPANPDKRAEIKMTDEQVISGTSSRSTKVKTFEALEPQTAKWANTDEALAAFQEGRSKLINYIKSTDDDMRNHIATQSPLGAMDAYQLILLISSHTKRHVLQINEIKADAGFPK